VILLTTNLFKKEFSNLNSNNYNNSYNNNNNNNNNNSTTTITTSSVPTSSNEYEISLAINCLANIATKDLAQYCISDILILMCHNSSYIRKKSILTMYKLYMKYPQGLRLTFDKLKDKLDDSDISVVSTAVNVICELANKNPKNYLSMAPKFFKLLTTSSNNWMLIKIVKLLGKL